MHNDPGVLVYKRGKVAEAADHFKAALQSNPNDPDLLANLALTEVVQHRFDEACADYRAAIRMKPDSAVLHEALAGALENLGKNDAAIAHLNIAARLSPKTETRVNLARLLFMTHDYRRAMDEYRKVLLG